MALGRYASRSYLFALGTAFPLAAPFFAPGGGYGHIMDFKAALYLILTAAFVLVSLFDLPREKGFFRSQFPGERALPCSGGADEQNRVERFPGRKL